jgi:hypothetical protein
MAALSGPASTMTVLRGETLADFFTKRSLVAWQRHRTENALQAGEGVIGRSGAAFEYIDRVFTRDDNRVAPIRGLTRVAEVALKLRKRRLHRESDYLINATGSRDSVHSPHLTARPCDQRNLEPAECEQLVTSNLAKH